MTLSMRALLGPLAGALSLFAACSEPSRPDSEWYEGSNDAGSNDEGEPPAAGAGPAGGSAPAAQGGRAGGASSTGGKAGGSMQGEAGDDSAGVAGANGTGATMGSGGRAGANAGSGGKASSSGGRPSGSAGKGGAPSGGSTGQAGAEPGTAGAPSTDDEFFGDSRCSEEFLFCDDFEAGELREEWQPQGTPPTLDSARQARGERSARFEAEGNGLAILRLPIEETTLYYGRLFAYLDVLPTAPRWAHWTLAGAIGNGVEAEIRVGGQFDGESNRFGVGTDHGPTGDWTLLSEEQDSVPVKRWICIEWLHDASNNETRFWSDEVEHSSLHTTLTDHGGEGDYELPAFTEVFVGWWQYALEPTPNEYQVWIDEVALHTERIGCTR